MPEAIKQTINNYESIFVIDPDKSEEEINTILERVKEVISSNGEIEKVDDWGKRRLAYPINFKNEGYYVLINFSSKPEFLRELERVYRITDGIVRFIVVRQDMLPVEKEK